MTPTKYITPLNVGWFLILSLLIYFPVFHYLDHLPIRYWDESLFGLRALYMHKTGEYMSNFSLYDGFMDHKNTKLPFTTWIQVLFIKMMGVKVLALRLPIAFIFLATIGYVLRYTKRHLSAISIGVIFTLIMICSHGIVRPHILRTGDQDLPFLCYLLISVISYFHYLQSKRKKHLIVFVLSISAALLTKNLLAGAVLPGLFLYTFFAKKIKSVLTDKFIWFSIFAISFIFGGVIFYLNYRYPGFIKRMWGYELLGRYTSAKDGHKGDFDFFFKEIAFVSFQYYFWLVPISLLVLFSEKLSKYSSELIKCLSFVYFSYIVIISFAETKLFWYIIPAIPYGALMISIALHHFFTCYIFNWSKYLKYSAIIIASILLFVLPYKQTIDFIITCDTRNTEENFGKFIKTMEKDTPIHNSYTIAAGMFGTVSRWYVEMYNIEKGYELEYNSKVDFEDGELVMTCLDDVGLKLHKKYNYEVWREYESCKFVKILSRK